jgi:hypothetical protein
MASINLEILPFTVPDEVSIKMPGTGKREDGIKPAITMKLSDLEVDSLIALCEEFTNNVFAAAGKSL